MKFFGARNKNEKIWKIETFKMAEFKNASVYTDFWSEEIATGNWPMRDFYRGKVILLTGGTGFLGQIYVEKLLR